MDRIKAFLENNKNLQKAEFDKKIIQSNFYIYGIKTKLLENFAKNLLKENFSIYDIKLESHEEILLAGFMIAFSKELPEKKIELIKHVLPYIDNWASCDMIVSRLKGLESQKEFFISLLNDENVFVVRVGVIWLFKTYVKTNIDYLYNLFNDINFDKWCNDKSTLTLEIKKDSYYVKMAIAWCYSEACIYNFKFMFDKLQIIKDDFIKRKTIQKACESFRIDNNDKLKLKSLLNNTNNF